MNYTNPAALERYAFMWSEVRLIVAAVALLIGGVPPIYLIAPASLFGAARTGLTVAWIISGITAVYLIYRWWQHGQHVFGKKDAFDLAAFAVLALSGLNLGWVGVTGNNIGMSIAHSRFIFFLTAAAYLYAAYHLYTRWQKNGQKLF